MKKVNHRRKVAIVQELVMFLFVALLFFFALGMVFCKEPIQCSEDPICVPTTMSDGGVIKFPSTNFELPFEDVQMGQGAQRVVDLENCGAYIHTPNRADLFGDHAGQGFDVIRQLRLGDMVEFQRGAEVRTYVVIKIDGCGTNLGSDLIDGNGNSVFDYEGGVVTMYCCNDFSGSVTLVTCSPVTA